MIRLHAPYLAGCVLIVAGALLWARRLGRPMGVLLLALCALYLALNLAHMWQEPAMATSGAVLRQDWRGGHAP